MDINSCNMLNKIKDGTMYLTLNVYQKRQIISLCQETHSFLTASEFVSNYQSHFLSNYYSNQLLCIHSITIEEPRKGTCITIDCK